MGYFTNDKPNPRGEICVKKAHMMSSYYKNPEATANAFTSDGYFKTGDIGEQIDKDKYIIISRKKHIFKLAQGEFIAPEALENSYQSCTYIDQIFIYGNRFKDFLLAVVVPNKNEILSWYNKNYSNKDLTYNEICQLTETNKFLLHQLYITGLSKSLVSYEFIRGILIECEPFSLENNCLTGPFKLNRSFCEKKYHDSLEDLIVQIELIGGSEDILKNHLSEIIKETVSKLTSDVLGTDNNHLQLDFNLLQLGLDSLSALKLSNQIHQTLGKQIKVSSLLSAKNNLNDLIQLISDDSNNDHDEIIDFNQESILDDHFIPILFENQNQLNNIDFFDNSHFLLTGSTGFLGCCLLESILENSLHSHITCLVRKDYEDCISIFKNAWGDDKFKKIWNENRITFLNANFSKGKL